jgi:hypothetical protein
MRGGYRPGRMAQDDYVDGKRLIMHDDAKATIAVNLEQELTGGAGKTRAVMILSSTRLSIYIYKCHLSM